MPAVAELELPVFDLTDPTLRGDRYHEVMAALGEQGWLATVPYGYVVLDRESAAFFLRSRETTFPGLKIAELFGIESGPLHEEIVRNIITVNGADHSRLRQLVNPALSPRSADRVRPAMREFLGQLWDAVPADGAVDFVEAVAKPYPALVIAHVMGAPLSDAPRLHEWSNWIQRQFDAPSLMADRLRIEQAVQEFYEWAGELLEDRRATPGDDLISTLIAAEAEGVDRLSDVELVNLVLNVLVGGVDTSQAQLSHTMRLLAEHPDQWAALRADPERLAGWAVEESLRYEPITPFSARITMSDVEHRGVTFPEGTVVMVSAFHGNRDGLADGDSFDITREPSDKPLTFGAGIHYCLGANIARAELQEALVFLAARIERLELDGGPEFDTITGIYGLNKLPLRLIAG